MHRVRQERYRCQCYHCVYVYRCLMTLKVLKTSSAVFTVGHFNYYHTHIHINSSFL